MVYSVHQKFKLELNPIFRSLESGEIIKNLVPNCAIALKKYKRENKSNGEAIAMQCPRCG
ncbi:hypothetical protein [uncultured Nostoc sp.]|uniref:hypothetical protein n=1 Tax=uncultured Nostoc sp. TaxID=340711 RepID=UPI0035C9A5DE